MKRYISAVWIFLAGVAVAVALTARSDISPLGGVTLPSGTVIAYAGTGTPSGFLDCNDGGTAVSRSTYAALFAAIGTTWGTGDGSTTFNKPNFQRRALVGQGGAGTASLAATVGSTGGDETVLSGGLPSHTHGVGTLVNGIESQPHTHSVPGLSVPGLSVPSLSVSVSGADHSHIERTQPGVGGTAVNAVGTVSGSGTVQSIRAVDGAAGSEVASGNLTTATSGSLSMSGTTGTGTTGTGTTGTGTSSTNLVNHDHAISGSTAIAGGGSATSVRDPAAVVRYLCKT